MKRKATVTGPVERAGAPRGRLKGAPYPHGRTERDVSLNVDGVELLFDEVRFDTAGKTAALVRKMTISPSEKTAGARLPPALIDALMTLFPYEGPLCTITALVSGQAWTTPSAKLSAEISIGTLRVTAVAECPEWIWL